jgi:hypothetical protein
MKNHITKKQIECPHAFISGLCRFPIVDGKIWVCANCGILKIQGINFYYNNLETLENALPLYKKRHKSLIKLVEHQIELYRNNYLDCKR